MDKPIPRIGVGVLIKKDGKILLGRRKNTHGEGTWQPPGGHLEFGESVANCAIREVIEETGLTITDITQPTYTEDYFETEGKHYISLFVVADWAGGEPELREPDKCAEWEWCDWESLPRPLFRPLENLLEQGYHPFKEVK